MQKFLEYLFPSLMIKKDKIPIEMQLEHLGGYWERHIFNNAWEYYIKNGNNYYRLYGGL